MNHSEIRRLFEKKINEACDTIKSSKNGDMLSAKISLSYINDSLAEKQDYNGRDNTSLVATAVFYEKNHESDEDPAYEISLLCDLKGGEVKNPTELAQELESFDKELARFTSLLSSSEDVFKLITDEDQRITLEGKKMVSEMESSLKKMKRIGIILGIGLLAILLAFTLIK